MSMRCFVATSGYGDHRCSYLLSHDHPLRQPLELQEGSDIARMIGHGGGNAYRNRVRLWGRKRPSTLLAAVGAGAPIHFATTMCGLWGRVALSLCPGCGGGHAHPLCYHIALIIRTRLQRAGGGPLSPPARVLARQAAVGRLRPTLHFGLSSVATQLRSLRFLSVANRKRDWEKDHQRRLCRCEQV